MRVVRVRTGVVLDDDGGALAKMLPLFRLGVGGPVAGGDQYMPWIHLDDLVALYLRALDDAAWSGRRSTATAPEPGDQQGLLARRSAARCTAPRSPRSPASRVAPALRRDGRDRRPTASAPCRSAPQALGFTLRATRSSTRRCATRSPADRAARTPR